MNDDETGANVAVLSAIVKINSAAELDNPVWMYECLVADDAHIINLDAASSKKYHRRLFKAKAAKSRVQLTQYALHISGFPAVYYGSCHLCIFIIVIIKCFW